MSRQTEEARAARDAAQEDWRRHRLACAPCDTAAQRRRPRAMCAAGQLLNRAYSGAQAALTAEIKADKLPIPGQEPLFLVKGG